MTCMPWMFQQYSCLASVRVQFEKAAFLWRSDRCNGADEVVGGREDMAKSKRG